ncbi:MAG TPA: diguanylate cyclase [Azospira sp.]|nr:diguanylate cyclase [Azospira sp.]
MMKLLADDKSLLQVIYDTSSVAIFLVDMTGRIVHANRRMGEMFRCPMDQLVGSEYVSLIHPQEREAGRQKMLNLMARGVTNVDLERLYRRHDGSEFWGNLTGKALRDENGRTMGLVGNIADIDQRKHVEWELSASQERFERLARTVPCVLYDYLLLPDGSGQFLYLNSRCEEVLELSAEALLADTEQLWQMVHQDDLPRLRAEEAAANRNCTLFSSEIRLRTPSGKLKWLRLSSRPNIIEPGQSAVWSGFMLDITETKQLEGELRQLATTDALTGLANRHQFLHLVDQEMARFHRSSRRAAVLMLDLDYFKHINDTYGHAVGDGVLRDFTRRVGLHLRSVDLFGRLGGEEFCILSPDTDQAGGRALGDRLCKAVAALPAQVDGHAIAYTVSVGVTEFRVGDHSFDAILARADAALYQAKRYGRNQVAVM